MHHSCVLSPLARSLEQQHSVRVEGEVASLHQQLRRLQEKLQQQMTYEKNLREENDQLRKRCVCMCVCVCVCVSD